MIDTLEMQYSFTEFDTKMQYYDLGVIHTMIEFMQWFNSQGYLIPQRFMDNHILGGRLYFSIADLLICLGVEEVYQVFQHPLNINFGWDLDLFSKSSNLLELNLQ